jgi:hypothetical protein
MQPKEHKAACTDTQYRHHPPHHGCIRTMGNPYTDVDADELRHNKGERVARFFVLASSIGKMMDKLWLNPNFRGALLL